MSASPEASIVRVRGCTGRVELENPEVCSGEPVRGAVTFSEERRGCRVQRTQVYLGCPADSDGEMYPFGDPVVVAEDFLLQPGASERFEFTLPTRRSFWVGPVPFHLSVHFAGAWLASERRLAQPVLLLPPREYVDLGRVLSDVAGLVLGDWGVVAAGDGLRVVLRPGGEAQGFADRFSLELFPSRERYYGTLRVNLGRGQGRSPAPPRSVSFPVSGRFGDLEAARQEFETLLEPLRRAATEAGALPIPSAVEEPAVLPSLPRPAGGAADRLTSRPLAANSPEER